MGGGSEVTITENTSDDKSLDACKVPLTLEEVENTDSESSPVSENAVNKANNECAIKMNNSDDDSKDPTYPLGM